MCMEDVRIGRATQAAESQQAVGVASAQIVAASPNCFSLIFSPPVVGNITLSTVTPVVLNAGYNLSAGGPPLILTLEQHGAMVTKAWFAIGSAATTIQVIQTLLGLQ